MNPKKKEQEMLKTNNKVVVGGCSSVYHGNSSTVRFKFEFRRNLFVKSYSYNFFVFKKINKNISKNYLERYQQCKRPLYWTK